MGTGCFSPEAVDYVARLADKCGTSRVEAEGFCIKLSITGVPCFVFTPLNEGISGAQPPEVLGDAINRAAQR